MLPVAFATIITGLTKSKKKELTEQFSLYKHNGCIIICDYSNILTEAKRKHTYMDVFYKTNYKAFIYKI